MKFSIAEKLAFVNVIDSVILADGKVHSGEINALSKLMQVLDFDSNFLVQARNLNTAQSIVILDNISQEKKQMLALILEDVAISDGFKHEKEVEVIGHVFSAIGIVIKHKN